MAQELNMKQQDSSSRKKGKRQTHPQQQQQQQQIKHSPAVVLVAKEKGQVTLYVSLQFFLMSMNWLGIDCEQVSSGHATNIKLATVLECRCPHTSPFHLHTDVSQSLSKIAQHEEAKVTKSNIKLHENSTRFGKMLLKTHFHISRAVLGIGFLFLFCGVFWNL